MLAIRDVDELITGSAWDGRVVVWMSLTLKIRCESSWNDPRVNRQGVARRWWTIIGYLWFPICITIRNAGRRNDYALSCRLFAMDFIVWVRPESRVSSLVMIHSQADGAAALVAPCCNVCSFFIKERTKLQQRQPKQLGSFQSWCQERFFPASSHHSCSLSQKTVDAFLVKFYNAKEKARNQSTITHNEGKETTKYVDAIMPSYKNVDAIVPSYNNVDASDYW